MTAHDTLLIAWPKHPGLFTECEVSGDDVTLTTLTYDIRHDGESFDGVAFSYAEVTGAKLGPYQIDRQTLIDIVGVSEVERAEEWITDTQDMGADQ